MWTLLRWMYWFYAKSKTYFFLTNVKRIINNTKTFSTSKKMKKLYCVSCGNYRKFKNPKISYILENNITSFHYLQKV